MLEYIRQNRKWVLAEGIFFIILGLLAMALPMLFTFAITIFLGSLMIIGGIAQAVRLSRLGSIPHGWVLWLYAIAISVTGLLILLSPTVGVLTLTLLLTTFFIIAGLSKMILAFKIRPVRNWGWLLFSGLLSLALAALIIIGWPSTALWVLGLMLGINLLFYGLSTVTLVMSLDKSTNHPPSIQH